MENTPNTEITEAVTEQFVMLPDTQREDEGVQTFTNPVAPGADPFVLKDDDGTYYLYATSGDAYGYRVYSSKNLVEWTSHGYCLVRDDVYTDPDSEFDYLFWAPEVLKYNGKYYLVYTAQHRIGIAVSDSPIGPFTNDAKRYPIKSANVIDGNFFVDDDGKVYLYFVTQRKARFGLNSVTAGNNIWGCEFNMDDLSIDIDSIELLVQWDPEIEVEAGGDCCEGPFMIKHNGVYYLTFSSNRYQSTKYSVQYATGTSPLGEFKRDINNITLMCDDLLRQDTKNPHLYGTGHHSFVEAPNGKDMLIFYHAHRAGSSSAGHIGNDLVAPRSTCVDLAWFTEDGKLLAGTKEAPTVPTAVAQPLFEGTSLEREVVLEGSFEKLSSLPTVYVAQVDGLDGNPGTKERPFRTLDRAFSKLVRGGTIVLLQSYNGGDMLETPMAGGPWMITAEHNNVLLTFKYIKIRRPLYFDNIIFAPESVTEAAVIECNFNDVVMGAGVSCLNRPLARNFPYIVGGKWNYNGTATSSVFNKFKYDEAQLTTDKEYSITLRGGIWEQVFAGSADTFAPVENSAVNAKVYITSNTEIKN